MVVLSIAIVLSSNKKKIDGKNRPVDRSNIPVAVSVAKVETGQLDVNVQYPALVEPLEEAGIYSQASGIISKLEIYLGKQVRKGEVIGRLDTRIQQINLKSALVSLKSAELSRDKAFADYQRATDLYEHKAGLETDMLTSKSNYENALASYQNAQVQVELLRQQIANSAIVSPSNGTISAHKINEGEYVNPGTAIATVSNISSVKATVYVDQQTSYQLRPGQQASISSPVFAGKPFTGKTVFISPVADDNHNYQVDLLIVKTPGISLKGGTDVQVSFNTLVRKDVLLVPRAALVTESANPTVFVVENRKAVEKPVKTGRTQNDSVEIISGLQPGETVVTSGLINVKNGSLIQIVN